MAMGLAEPPAGTEGSSLPRYSSSRTHRPEQEHSLTKLLAAAGQGLP